MKRPVPDSQRAEMERLASALESWRPALERFQPTSPLPWIELNDEDLQLQFEVYEAMVSITMPYFRDRAEEMMKCATDSFDVVKFSGMLPFLQVGAYFVLTRRVIVTPGSQASPTAVNLLE
jgi:hypothetical protein